MGERGTIKEDLKVELSRATLSGSWAGGGVASAHIDEVEWGEHSTLQAFPPGQRHRGWQDSVEKNGAREVWRGALNLLLGAATLSLEQWNGLNSCLPASILLFTEARQSWIVI